MIHFQARQSYDFAGKELSCLPNNCPSEDKCRYYMLGGKKYNVAVFEAVGNQFGYMGLGNVMHMNVFTPASASITARISAIFSVFPYMEA